MKENMMRISRIFTFLVILCGVVSCREVDESVIVGSYGIDKTRTFKGKQSTFDEILTLNQDNTFALKIKDSIVITGNWKIYMSEYKKGNSGRMEPQAFVDFTFNGRKITGMMNSNIFYFSDPDTFIPETYETVLYVKLSNRH